MIFLGLFCQNEFFRTSHKIYNFLLVLVTEIMTGGQNNYSSQRRGKKKEGHNLFVISLKKLFVKVV